MTTEKLILKKILFGASECLVPSFNKTVPSPLTQSTCQRGTMGPTNVDMAEGGRHVSVGWPPYCHGGTQRTLEVMAPLCWTMVPGTPAKKKIISRISFSRGLFIK